MTINCWTFTWLNKKGIRLFRRCTYKDVAFMFVKSYEKAGFEGCEALTTIELRNKYPNAKNYIPKNA